MSVMHRKGAEGQRHGDSDGKPAEERITGARFLLPRGGDHSADESANESGDGERPSKEAVGVSERQTALFVEKARAPMLKGAEGERVSGVAQHHEHEIGRASCRERV